MMQSSVRRDNTFPVPCLCRHATLFEVFRAIQYQVEVLSDWVAVTLLSGMPNSLVRSVGLVLPGLSQLNPKPRVLQLALLQRTSIVPVCADCSAIAGLGVKRLIPIAQGN